MVYFLKPLNVSSKYNSPRNPKVKQINREQLQLKWGEGSALWSSSPVLSSTDSIHPSLHGLKSLFHGGMLQRLFSPRSSSSKGLETHCRSMQSIPSLYNSDCQFLNAVKVWPQFCPLGPEKIGLICFPCARLSHV